MLFVIPCINVQNSYMQKLTQPKTRRYVHSLEMQIGADSLEEEDFA